MAELKPGWQRVKFGDVVRLNKETCKDPEAEGIERVIGLEHLEPGDLRVRSWADVADGTTFTKRVRPGQVLFGKRRAYQRKVAVAGFKAVCSGDIYVFESADPKRLLPGLLPFICQSDSFHGHAVGTSAGSLSPRTNWRQLAEFQLDIPEPGEQQRILSVLTASSALINSLDELLSRARLVRDRLRLDAAQVASTTTELSSWLSFLTSGSRGWAKYYSEEGQVFIRIGNLNSPSIELNMSDTQRVTVPLDGEATRTRVEPGDVLLGITGESGVGLVGIARSCEEQHFISQHIALIRLDSAKACPEFVAHILASAYGQRQIWRHNQSSAKAGITLLAVKDFLMPDLALCAQRDWANRISKCEASMAEIASRLTRAIEAHNKIRESILAGVETEE